MSTTKTARPTTAANNKRINELENEVASLKEQVAALSTAAPSGGSDVVLGLVRDLMRLQRKQMMPSQFNARYAHFLETGEL